jgi:H+-transporting ATPase
MAVTKDSLTYQGLSSEEAKKQIALLGKNEIVAKRNTFPSKFSRWITSPITLMLLAAAFLSLFIGKIFEFYFILFLTLVNFIVGFWQEHKADRAIEELQEKLAVSVPTMRDGAWTEIESQYIVPGDVIKLSVGDIMPADGKALEAVNVSMNEAALTGESLPKEKETGKTCYAGSYVATGSLIARIVATGNRTFFGKSIVSLERSAKKSLLEKDILMIAKFLSAASIIGVVFLTVFLLSEGKSLFEVLTLDLGLLIAGVPVALPAVMSLIISFGVIGLAKKKVIVRRISAIEDLSNVDLLLSDKTGTLTKNEIQVARVIAYKPFKEKDLVRYGYWSSVRDERSAINKAIIAAAHSYRVADNPAIVSYIPADSVRKHSSVSIRTNGRTMTVIVGAPQVVSSLCKMTGQMLAALTNDVDAAAQEGYRAIALAVREGENNEKGMSLMGIILMSDTLREDAVETIEFMKANGIDVRMVTGDNSAIARRVSQSLGLKGLVVTRGDLASRDGKNIPSSWLEGKAVFAEVLPEDKYALVEIGKKSHVVAVTGDGVNDLPALSIANVGIAVKEAVAALKSAADIVLLSSGIAVIKEAIIEARKIFARLYTYSVYRISESFRLVVTIIVLGIIYVTYPLAPIQLIILALLNDLPIVSLATDRVKIADRPSHINVRERFVLSFSYGIVGVINSLLMFFLAHSVLHLPDSMVQTMFFLKLAVGGHMLVYVAHTKERWYKFWPSKEVIWATSLTQLVATIFAVGGLFMGRISIWWALAIWGWAFIWMQMSELAKIINARLMPQKIK